MSAPVVDPQDVARSARSDALFANLMHFARTLRAAGMNVGSGKILECLNAVEAVGVERRDDFYWTLHAVLVAKASDREVFDQAFHVFWRNPKLLERAFGMSLPPPSLGQAQPEPLMVIHDMYCSPQVIAAIKHGGRISKYSYKRHRGEAIVR